MTYHHNHRNEDRVVYSDGADHSGVGTFGTLKDAETFAAQVRKAGYQVEFIHKRMARVARPSQRVGWVYPGRDYLLS